MTGDNDHAAAAVWGQAPWMETCDLSRAGGSLTGNVAWAQLAGVSTTTRKRLSGPPCPPGGIFGSFRLEEMPAKTNIF